MSDVREDVRALVDAIPALAWSARPDGRPEYLDQRWVRYAGLSDEDVERWSWSVVLHPEDHPRFVTRRLDVVAAAEPAELEVRLRRRDSEYRR